MTRYVDRPVPVRGDPLGMQIGAVVDAVGVEPVHLPGAVAHVDPASPWSPPAISVLDPVLAADVLDELWGPAAVDLVQAGEDGRVEPQDCGPGLALLHDLGTARWLERWRPYPLDPALLRLDVLSAELNCDGLLEEDDDEADESADDVLGSRIEQLVVDVEATLSAARDQSTGRRQVPEWVAGLGRPRAAAASTTASLLLSGTTTADWDRVPTGTVSRAESAVHWSIESRLGSATLHLVTSSAEIGARHPATTELAPAGRVKDLRFRLYTPGWPLPLVEGVLAPVGDTESWAGAVELSPQAAERATQAGPGLVLVDVVRPGQPTPPRVGETALRARAHRWAVRSVAGRRLAQETGDPTLTTQARSAGRQAIALWASLREDALIDLLATCLADDPDGLGVSFAHRLGLAERWALLGEQT
jgi:hypothetical protein